MLDVQVIDDPATAEVSLDLVRARLLAMGIAARKLVERGRGAQITMGR